MERAGGVGAEECRYCIQGGINEIGELYLFTQLNECGQNAARARRDISRTSETIPRDTSYSLINWTFIILPYIVTDKTYHPLLIKRILSYYTHTHIKLKKIEPQVETDQFKSINRS